MICERRRDVGHLSAGARQHHVRRKLGERNSKKRAVLYIGVWDNKIVRCHNQVVVYQHVEVYGPRRVFVLRAHPPKLFLYPPQHQALQLGGRCASLNLHDAIIKQGLLGLSLWLSLVKSGDRSDPKLPSEHAQSLSHIPRRLDIRSYPDEDARHSTYIRPRVISTPTLLANRSADGFSTVTCACSTAGFSRQISAIRSASASTR